MVQPTVGTKAFVVEATVLQERGREHAEYKKALFEVDPITKWDNCSKTNLVVSQPLTFSLPHRGTFTCIYPRTIPFSSRKAAIHSCLRNQQTQSQILR
jgi:hypothetical protein